MRRSVSGLLVTVLAVGPAAVSLRAQPVADTASVRRFDDTRAQRLFAQLMSPYCPGLTIATCPSPGADSLRWDIRARLDRGDAPDAIVDRYVSVWGEQILGAPPARRFGLLLWILPGASLVVGAAGLSAWLWRVRRRTAEVESEPRPGSDSPIEPALVARLEAELRRFDS